MQASTGPTDMTASNPAQRIQVGLQIDIEGQINPAILLPRWFKREGLLTDGEVKDASDSLDQDEGYVFFRTQDFTLEATPEKLRLYSLHEGLQLAYRDLVLNIFTLLRHTPLTWLRIIRFAHLAPALPTEEQLPSPPVQAHLAWERIADFDSLTGLVDQSTVASVSVEGVGPGSSRATITVEPSSVENAEIYVAGAYAYDLASHLENQDITSSDVLVNTLKEEWEKVVAHSEQVFNNVSTLLIASTAS